MCDWGATLLTPAAVSPPLIGAHLAFLAWFHAQTRLFGSCCFGAIFPHPVAVFVESLIASEEKKVREITPFLCVYACMRSRHHRIDRYQDTIIPANMAKRDCVRKRERYRGTRRTNTIRKNNKANKKKKLNKCQEGAVCCAREWTSIKNYPKF